MKKQSKKVIALVLTMALLCSSMMGFGALAAAGGTLTLGLLADKTSYKAGDTVVLTVSASNFVNITDGIAGFTLNLGFDDTKFDYVAVSETTLQPQNPGALSVNQQANNLIIVLADATELPMLFMTEGNLISLSFTAKTNITPADYNFTLGTYNSVTEDFVDNDGIVTVTYPVPLAVTITSGSPTALELLGTSALRIVGGEYVYGISESTTVADVKVNFAHPELIIITKGLTILENTDIVGTGCVVKLMVDTQTVDTLSVIIKGDVSGNGVIGLEDLTQIRDDLLEITPLTGNAYLAGNIYGEASITLNDLVAIMADVSENSSIIQ